MGLMRSLCSVKIECCKLHHKICFDVIRFLLIDLKVDVLPVDLNKAINRLCKYHYNCDRLVDIIRLILDHNTCTIDVNHKNKKGEDAMYILRDKGKLLVKNTEEIMELLTKRGAHNQ